MLNKKFRNVQCQGTELLSGNSLGIPIRRIPESETLIRRRLEAVLAVISNRQDNFNAKKNGPTHN